MRSLVEELSLLVPSTLAVSFLVWFFWNLCKQYRRR